MYRFSNAVSASSDSKKDMLLLVKELPECVFDVFDVGFFSC